MHDNTLTIRFCGTAYKLEELSDCDFIDLFDAVIDYGCDLMEQADYMPVSVYNRHASQNRKAQAENSRLLALLDQEAERRKAVAA